MKKNHLSNITIQFALILTIAVLSGCSNKKQHIAQGKLISVENMSQLQLGITKQQARIILGSPAIIDSFSPDTWIYYYSKTKINSQKPQNIGKLILNFDRQVLINIEGDENIVIEKDINKGGTIITEPTIKNRGIFSR